MNETEVLPKICIQIYNSSDYCGSGVLVKLNGQFYVFSAAHVFTDNPKKSIAIQGFHGVSEEYGKIEFSELKGGIEPIQKYDIVVALVKNEGGFLNFPCIKFCQDITFPDISLIFRGTQRSVALKPHSVTPCTIDTPVNNESLFCIKVPLESYANMKGDVGAEVMSGYSGSGIFIRGVDDIYLVGITLNVDDDDFTGVNCRSIQAVKELFIPDMELSDFHGGNKPLKINVANIRKEVTKEMILNRKSESYGDVENITRKMNAFIENWTTEDLDEFVEDILVWENIENSKIRNNSTFREPIENAKSSWRAGHRKYQVSSISKGNERFHKLLDDLTDLLKEELEGTPYKSNSSVIAAGEVARLLANCNLRFDLIK